MLKSYKSKMSIIYTQSWKQCAIQAITIMTLWQLMHLGTWSAVMYCWHQWMLLTWLVEDSLVYWCPQCVMVHHVPKCMSCHKATVVITRRAHFFHDYIYITAIFLWWDLGTLRVMDHLRPFTLCSLLGLMNTLWFIGTSNV